MCARWRLRKFLGITGSRRPRIFKDDYAPDIERDREDWRKTENWLLRLEAEA